ncbi:MAG TPA: alpha/beta hydrolase [Gemmataceae bacterium]|nr:alpha/beta hydrolase [Gemmataceae bacterium]
MSEARFTWQQLVWRPVLRGLKSVAFIYVGVLVLMLLLENYLVYPGTPATRDWMPAPIGDIQDVDLVTESSVKIHGWYLPCPNSERTLLYFHGNGGNLSHRGGSMVKLSKALDTAVFMVDYPGYGKSEGSTTEAGCYESATAAYDWLIQTQNRDPTQLILYGASLGGAVAAELATRKPHGVVVLVKTFTSLPDVAANQYPFLPVRWLMRNRMATIDRIRSINSPVLIAHGDADHLIPFAHGQQLFAAALEPKIFVRLPGQGHDESLGADFFLPLKTFLNTHLPTAAVAEPQP